MKNRVPAELKLHAPLIALREKRGLTQQTRPGDDLRLLSDAASRLVPEEETAIRPATGNVPRNPVAAERRFVENGGANQ